ncbi:Mu transposase C-terminal domain-containing protein [Sphingorhabdus sp. EL138]|uniref:Mu transposase C-terminal domain-containing protein n=1 Tax=Sphingorhabdus sp. EL138 TaxID=2073156 RepID=UPI000D69D550|nr:Mu transposase C-terminal domain-containing protein [Sphingorhabdus sp. EL138]
MKAKAKEYFANSSSAIALDDTRQEIEKQNYRKARELGKQLRPYLTRRTTPQQVDVICKSAEISRPTFFRKLRKFRNDPRISSLVANKSSGGAKTSRLDPDVLKIIEKVMKSYFRKHKSNAVLRDLWEHIVRACLKEGLKAPSESTVRRHYHALSARDKARMKYGAKYAYEQFDRKKGTNPERTFPLERVQIDHTLCDIELLDSVTREEVGRPWITIVMDEYSRAVLSFVLTFEAPSATTVAYALTRAVLPKEDWLASLSVNGSWPFRGKPHRIFTDNGSDFTSKAINFGCDEWLIPRPEKRPKGSPQYGGQIERIIGTVMKKTKLLPGATARNFELAVKKGRHNGKKTATMTLREYEAVLATWFVQEYHARPHAGLGISPMEQWRRGIEGYGKQPGIGEPELVSDPKKFFIDFLPGERRTLQRYGFVWNYIEYCDDSLQPHLDMSLGQRYLVKRNPHDISKIYWLNPKDNKYYQIRATTPGLSGYTLWEWNKARELVKNSGTKRTVEAIAERMRQEEVLLGIAKAETKRVRKASARKLDSKHVTKEMLGEDETVSEPIETKPFVRQIFKVEKR